LGEELLRVEDLSSPGKFSRISSRVRRGEILGFAGLVGAGRSEVAQPSSDWTKPRRQSFCARKELPLGSVTASLRAGIGVSA